MDWHPEDFRTKEFLKISAPSELQHSFVPAGSLDFEFGNRFWKTDGDPLLRSSGQAKMTKLTEEMYVLLYSQENTGGKLI